MLKNKRVKDVVVIRVKISENAEEWYPIPYEGEDKAIKSLKKRLAEKREVSVEIVDENTLRSYGK